MKIESMSRGWALSLVALLGCTTAGVPEKGPGVAGDPAFGVAGERALAHSSEAPLPDGVYRVSGSGQHWAGQRSVPVRGYITLRSSGAETHSSFELLSTRSNRSDRVLLQWIGRGEARMRRGRLRGHAEIEILRAGRRAVDVRLPFRTHRVGSRSRLHTQAYLLADGRVRFELTGLPDPVGGRTYARLEGFRVESEVEPRLALSAESTLAD